jgi:predicted metal-dependent hydrolase
MRKQIELHKRKIDYTLKVSKRAHRMRLAVYCDGSFTVTAPINVKVCLIENYLIQKSQWILDKIDYFKLFSKTLFVRNTEANYIKYKDTARQLADQRVEKYNKIYQFKFNKINIKNQKTRWGSCSRRGNINFNYKIALLPERLTDYIVVHELCHLGEFNHSRKFWNLVAKAIPDYLEIKSELKKSGLKFN